MKQPTAKRTEEQEEKRRRAAVEQGSTTATTSKVSSSYREQVREHVQVVSPRAAAADNAAEQAGGARIVSDSWEYTRGYYPGDWVRPRANTGAWRPMQ